MSVIWIREPKNSSEHFLRARKCIFVRGNPSTCLLRVTCSGRYRLWINEQLVSSGPAHSGSTAKRVDELEVGKFLQEGKNVLAVQLIHFDYYTTQVFCPNPGFWLSLKGGGADVDSDTTWRISHEDAFVLPSFRRNLMYGPQEIYDGRLEEAWQTLDYDDGIWPQAIEVPKPWAGPEIPRGIPQIREFEIRPVSISLVAEVVDQEHFPEMWSYQSYQSLAVSLLQDVPVPSKFTHVCGAENLLEGANGSMEISQPFSNRPDQEERWCATVIFDFGRAINGYGWIDVDGNEGAVVDMVYGELLTAGRVQAMRQGTHYADRYILREGRQQHQVYDWKGYRFVQVTFRNLTRPLIVHGIGATFCTYPVEPRGTFRCNDPKIEKIWATGVYTQKLCLHDRLMDCPWREQAQWLGDGRVQLLVIQNAFGEHPIVRKFIEDFAHSQRVSGLIPSISNRENESQDIMDYALWWVTALHDAAAWESDAVWLLDMIPYGERLLTLFQSMTNADGLLQNVPGWVLIDWAPLGRSGCIAPLNAIYYMALRSAENLNQRAGYADAAQCHRNNADRLAENFHRIFWCEENGFYRDCVAGDSTSASRFSQHTQALAVITGLARTNIQALSQRTLRDASLAQTSPFFAFYLLEALGVAGLAAEGLVYIREKWGKMIDAGATTFWEEWQTGATYRDGQWAARPRSLCHAWSAAPTAWISRYVLGIRQKSAEGELIFAPDPCGMIQAEGCVPTRHGIFHVAWSVRDGNFLAELSLPARCPEVEFIPPRNFVDRSKCISRRADNILIHHQES